MSAARFCVFWAAAMAASAVGWLAIGFLILSTGWVTIDRSEEEISVRIEISAVAGRDGDDRWGMNWDYVWSMDVPVLHGS